MSKAKRYALAVGGLAVVGMAILGVLLACPDFGLYSQSRAAEVFLYGTSTPALNSFRFDCGRFPTTEEGLDALVAPPAGVAGSWKGPYIDTRGMNPFRDPWGRSYHYRSPGVHNPLRYDIWSFGEDGVESEDGITNWN